MNKATFETGCFVDMISPFSAVTDRRAMCGYIVSYVCLRS